MKHNSLNTLIYSGTKSLMGLREAVKQHFSVYRRLPKVIFLPHDWYAWFRSVLPMTYFKPRFDGINVEEL